jgi:hypothetical protein
MAVTQWLLAPVFIHVALTTWIGRQTVISRIASVRAGETRIRDIAVDSTAWPDKVRARGNNFDSQFDLPMMWYASVAMMLATGLADWVAVVLSWAFAGLRIGHSYIHTGSNHVPTRMRVYVAGFGCVAAMWAWFGLRLYVIG